MDRWTFEVADAPAAGLSWRPKEVDVESLPMTHGVHLVGGLEDGSVLVRTGSKYETGAADWVIVRSSP